MTKEIFLKILQRAALEFGPPAAIGLLWAYINHIPG